MSYYRGNLAVELERQSRTVTKTKRTIRIKPTIPTGEKLLYLLFISITVIGLGLVGVRYSQISQYNYDIQSTKKENRLLSEKNAAVKLQIEQLSNRDRIQNEAERQGMVFNPEAVHVIGQSKSQAKVQASSLPATQTQQR
ncbi:cell division protein FtsL [Brevibacillus nitrificans]|uniref:Cell division protein FtsL n=1 Tax=Brevibacillus nitrificans TaxID=651560 RepID=A0A3M8DTS0_9BACL|nr:cell division protein FtsL [Brevibacillus nitrificans]MED1796910.1 cell division protein FtsL [Brevibacillus nitrificans]RNB90875.1 cell division protein FtsL [Brevibacillus nitrificans]